MNIKPISNVAKVAVPVAALTLLSACGVSQTGRELDVIGGPVKQGALDTVRQIRAEESESWRQLGQAWQEHMDGLEANSATYETPQQTARILDVANDMAIFGAENAQDAADLDNFAANLNITVINQPQGRVDYFPNSGIGTTDISNKAGLAVHKIELATTYDLKEDVSYHKRIEFPDKEHHFVGATILGNSDEDLNVKIARSHDLNLEGVLTMNRADNMIVQAAAEDVYTADGTSTAGLVYTGVVTGANAALGGPVPALIGFGSSAAQFLFNDAFDVSSDRAVRYRPRLREPTLERVMENDALHYARMGKTITDVYVVHTNDGAVGIFYASADPEKSKSRAQLRDDAVAFGLSETGPEVFVAPFIYENEITRTVIEEMTPPPQGFGGGGLQGR